MVGAGHPEIVRVLFVGNSFTYFHNLPAQVAALARPERAVRVAMIATGGAVLGPTWAGGGPAAALGRGWDFVVLQEQSTLGEGLEVDGVPRVRDPAAFHRSVRAAVPDIAGAGASPVLYMTWARRDDPSAQVQLADAYTAIGREVGAVVAPVGLAWRLALRERPDLVLHEEDNSHPAPAGSYLAACVFTATLLGLDPRGRAHRITGQTYDSEGEPGEPDGVLVDLPPVEAAYLQDVAWRATR